MNVTEAMDRLSKYDGDMTVVITDGEEDFAIDSMDDDGVDRVVIICGDKVEINA